MGPNGMTWRWRQWLPVCLN